MEDTNLIKLKERLLSHYGHILGDQQKNTSIENIIESIIAYYEAVMASMPGNVYWLDKNCIGVGCNKNTLDMFGFKSQSSFKGLNYEEMGKIGNWSSEAINSFKNDAMDVINTKKPRLNVEDLPIPNSKGEMVHFLTNRVPVFGRGNQFIGMIGVSIDITEFKKMQEAILLAKEKAETSNRMKSQFLAVINHELRTPLVSILGLIDFLKQVDLPAREEKNILAAIKNCTNHLLGLVNDVSDFNKLETGKYTVRYDFVNLDNLLYEIYGIFKTLARNKGLELKMEVLPDVPNVILTDTKILRQILINLINNAIKFTDSGQVFVKVEKTNEDDQLLHLIFSVTDTGTGIPEEKLKVIFEPFQQLEDPYTRQSSRSGTGLGLTIVAKLVKLINSKIEVESTIGKGSKFSFAGDFKKVTTELSESHDDANVKVDNKQLLETPTVLLIEDDPIVQYVHTKMLSDLGCQVQVISNGTDAINKINDQSIIFVDISLPDINGFEVIKRIRERQKRKIPIIALTVYTGKEEKEASLAAGANEFESKPISQAKFKKILLKYLGR